MPFLTATPDRMCKASLGGFKVFIDDDGNMQHEPTDKDFPIEIKTISGYASDLWSGGIPISYLCQIHCQMICTNTDYAELCLLKDGRTLEIYPVHRSEELVDMIIAKATDFFNKLTEARELLKGGVTDEVMKQISMLEPAAEGSEAYSEFLKKKFNIEDKTRVATQDEVLLMKNYLRASQLEKQAVDSKLDLKNKLLACAEEFMQLTSDEVSMVNKPKSEQQARAYFSIKLNKKK
jgi:predicted phage-related endonuclease